MRVSKETIYIKMAEVIALRSTCCRKKVGSIIVKEGRIISTGYNGYPSGMTNCIDLGECPEGPSCTYVVHAEANAILFAAKTGISVEGATMYCTLSPCTNCAKMIINSGIKKVIYSEEYRDTTGVDLLESCGIETELYIQDGDAMTFTNAIRSGKTYSLNVASITSNLNNVTESIKNATRSLKRSQKSSDFSFIVVNEQTLREILIENLKDADPSDIGKVFNLIKEGGL